MWNIQLKWDVNYDRTILHVILVKSLLISKIKFKKPQL
jgi:hypothetical protein